MTHPNRHIHVFPIHEALLRKTAFFRTQSFWRSGRGLQPALLACKSWAEVVSLESCCRIGVPFHSLSACCVRCVRLTRCPFQPRALGSRRLSSSSERGNARADARLQHPLPLLLQRLSQTLTRRLHVALSFAVSLHACGSVCECVSWHVVNVQSLSG